MHAATLSKSERLQRVHDLLADGREYSTMEIIQLADVCAVNSIAAELRYNGVDIRCRQEGRGNFYYKRWDTDSEEAA